MNRRKIRTNKDVTRWKALSLLLFVSLTLTLLHYMIFENVKDHPVKTVTEYVTVRDTVVVRDTVFIKPKYVKRDTIANDTLL